MAAEAPAARSLLEALVRALVNEPDEVKVEDFAEDDGTVVLELSVAEDDYGTVIGRGGRTANALRTPRAAAPPLEEDEYWADDLVGCAVVADGRELGRVARLLPYPSCDLLELESGQLVPLVQDAIASVDPQARRIEVHARFLGLEDS